jgi:hypothetical protein
MKNMSKKVILIIFMVALLCACGNQSAKQEEIETNYILSEIREGDFILQVFSQKSVYYSPQDIQIYAKLKYIGNDSTQTIYHAASPFYFSVYEINREVGIPFFMDQPGLTTVLKKDEWYDERYEKIVGQSDSFADDDFINEFFSNKYFPEGEYRIGVSATYSTEPSGRKYNLSTSIMIEVKAN